VPRATKSPPAPNKEARILTAAVRVFARNGYHGSTMAAVAQEAGVATGTIYLYFERKQDVLVALFRRHLTEYLERSRPVLLRAAPGVPRLRALARQHLAFFADDRELAQVFQIHIREPDPVLSEGILGSVTAYFDLIAQVISDGVASGAFDRELDVRYARQVFFGALDEVVTGWLRSRSSRSLMSALDPVATMLARAYGAAEPGDPS